MKNIKTRLIMYVIGLFIMTIGIALSVKSDLGVSPVSSIPYTMTCVWGIEMGIATVIFHTVLVLFQILILRRNFKVKNLLQIAVGVLFGLFTSLCNYAVTFIPDPTNIIIRVIMVLISTVFVAFGIFLYVPVNIMPLAGEGIMQTISNITGIEFPKVKIGFDVTMVVVSLAVCLIFIHGLGSVGAGTIICSVLVGLVLGVIVKLFGGWRNKLLNPEKYKGHYVKVIKDRNKTV